LGGDSPAEVDLDEFNESFAAEAPEFWKDTFNEDIAFLDEIAECGAEEDSDHSLFSG
jgi:hypothetical protein